MSGDLDARVVTESIAIPESNRWPDFVWPAWIPERERQLIEEFWCEDWGRGPRQWFDDSTLDCNAGIRTGARARMWCVRSDGPPLAEGRYVHRWNNIGSIVLDDGSCILVSGVATDEAIARRLAALDEQLAIEKRRLEAIQSEVAFLRKKP